jgi:guanosine-3',5'-bis(diphosphate) 3'-pyrophosphohydrolase
MLLILVRVYQLFLKALKFSAEKHSGQYRKGEQASPYINHPIEVVNILWNIGEVDDVLTLVGALLHDTIEDTNATREEINVNFGKEVLALVLEVSDDKTLPKQERKLKQIEKARSLSFRAKQIKLADKICNVSDIANSPPMNWTWQRKVEYLNWANNVVARLRGTNIKLEKYFEEILFFAEKKLGQEKPEEEKG